MWILRPPTPYSQPTVPESMDDHTNLLASASITNPKNMSGAPQETPIKLLKYLIESYDEPDVNSSAMLKELLVSDFDELFQQLKSKIADINLLEVVDANLSVIIELQELMSKLSQPESLSSISIVVLDMEIILD